MSTPEVPDQRDVGGHPVVVVAGDVAGVAVVDRARHPAEGVPDGRRPAVLVDRALDLVRRRGDAPPEARRGSAVDQVAVLVVDDLRCGRDQRRSSELRVVTGSRICADVRGWSARAGCSQQATVRLRPVARRRACPAAGSRSAHGSKALRAARVERAAGRHAAQVRRRARDAGQLAARAAQRREGVQQPFAVRVQRVPVQRRPTRASSTIRPPYMMAIRSENSTSSDRSWVMNRTEKPSRSRSSTSWRQDLPLHHHVERGGRLVHDDDLRLECQRHPDHHALAHAAGELVRVGVQPVGRDARPA